MGVSSGTRQKFPRTTSAFLQERTPNLPDTRAFLQDRAQNSVRLARFFRNAPKNSAKRLRVSSGTHPKTPPDLRVSSRTRPKIPRNDCAFLQERTQKLRQTLARFFRNAPKNSAKRLRVSSGTRPKNPPDTRAFLERRHPINSVKQVCVSSKTSSKVERNIFKKKIFLKENPS